MMTSKAILDLIRKKQEDFSPTQRRVADYVLRNPESIPFLTITQFSKNTGVSSNTIVLFCSQLGFEHFSQFKKIFAKDASSAKTGSHTGKKNSSNLPDSIEKLFQQEAETNSNNLKATLANEENIRNIAGFLKLLDGAKNVYVMGGRISGKLASMLAFLLRYMDLKVFEIELPSTDYLDKISYVEQGDLVIGFSFPRYTSQLVEAFRYFAERGINTVLFTDMGLSPAVPHSKLIFYCKISSNYYLNSYVACVVVIEVICQAAFVARGEAAKKHLDEMLELLGEHGVFCR